MLRDLRVGIRLFSRHPVLAVAAVCSLALGIGANTAIFSVLNAVVLRPLPVTEPDRLVVVWETFADTATRPVAPANFVDWRRESRTFEGLAAMGGFSANLTGRGEPERLRAASVSGNFFTTLGVTAPLGRTLLPSDDEADATPVAVLGDGLWQRMFGGSPSAIGQSLVLDGRPHTIVGVLPPRFALPTLGDTDVWLSGDHGIPRSFPFPGDLREVRDSHFIGVIGRLAPGATRAAAQAELTGVMQRLAEAYPDTNSGLGVNVVPLHEASVGDVRPLVTLLQAAVVVMLVIGCANVANLLLGLGASRQAEMGMRVALGAGRARLVRQLVAEALVLAVPGGVAGLLLAVVGLEALVALAPAGLPRLADVAIDGTVLAFTTGVTLATALAFGLGPAIGATRGGSLITPGAARIVGAGGARRWQQVMTVGELALAQVLLVGAGLLLASFVAANRVDLGFTPEGRVAADLSLAADKYLQPLPGEAESFRVDTGPKRRLVDAVVARVSAAPGVRAVAASFTAPMSGGPNRGVSIDGDPEPAPGLDSSADFQLVSTGYFRALGVTLLSGRVFADTDGAAAPPVAIVNQAFVDRYLPGRDPLRQVIRFGGDRHHAIVGVVANARYRDVERQAEPTFYVPLAQNDERWPFLSFTAWTDGDAAALAPVLRRAIREADPGQPITRVRTYDEILGAALAPRRFNTLLVGLFALTALLLAGVGAYGVIAYAVASRTREMGVRAALGATPASLVGQVVLQGIALAAPALVLGTAGAFAVTRLMRTMLFGVSPGDPGTMLGVAAALAAVALLATVIPARRAAGADPVVALRDG
ncbi:MAG: ABC transporter permease [Vicinamibacterales bacterium]